MSERKRLNIQNMCSYLEHHNYQTGYLKGFEILHPSGVKIYFILFYFLWGVMDENQRREKSTQRSQNNLK